MKTRIVGVVCLVVVSLAAAGPLCWAQTVREAERVVRYRATMDTVKYVYGPATPVARLNSGDILETNTVDAIGDGMAEQLAYVREKAGHSTG